jgi:ABC-type uncharacterized transport system permease subunit
MRLDAARTEPDGWLKRSFILMIWSISVGKIEVHVHIITVFATWHWLNSTSFACNADCVGEHNVSNAL